MATSRSLAQFSKRMKLRGAAVPENAKKLVQRAALAAHNTAVIRTPVDSGRARGNWVVSIGAPRIVELEEDGPQAANERLSEGRGTIGGWNPKRGPIYIANSLPYIEFLEDGSSAQAPNGMTRFAIAAARRQLGRSDLTKLGGSLNQFRGRRGR